MSLSEEQRQRIAADLECITTKAVKIAEVALLQHGIDARRTLLDEASDIGAAALDIRLRLELPLPGEEHKE